MIDATGDTAFYIYENVGLDTASTGDTAVYLYESVGVSVAAVGDTATYLYEMTGVSVAPVGDTSTYVYENVGVSVKSTGNTGNYLYENVTPALVLPPARPVVKARFVNHADVVFTWHSDGHSGSYEWENAATGSGPQQTVTIFGPPLGSVVSLRVRAYLFDSSIGQFVYSDWGYASIQVPFPITDGMRKPPSQRDHEHALQRQSQTVQTMLPGSAGGRVANSSPTANADQIITGGGGSAGAAELTTSFYGELVTGAIGPPLRITGSAIGISTVYATLGDAGSTNTEVYTTVDGTVVASMILLPGVTRSSVALNQTIAVDAVVRYVVHTAGDGAADLTMQART